MRPIFLLMKIMQSLLIPCTLPAYHWFAMVLCAQHAQITSESPADLIPVTLCRKQDFANLWSFQIQACASIPPNSRWIRNSQKSPSFSVHLHWLPQNWLLLHFFLTDRKSNVSIRTFNKKNKVSRSLEMSYCMSQK